MKTYKLPDLPYSYSALEPFISGRTMELHHLKHHGGYVKRANEAAMSGDDRKLLLNVDGHVLHSLFWKNMMPKGGGEPEGELLDALKESFGTFRRFQEKMNKAAEEVLGWSALVWEPLGSRLLVQEIHDHRSKVYMNSPILMVMDTWEHAYYLQYQNNKKEFFNSLWHLWNWSDISLRLEVARRPYVQPTEN